MIPNEWKGDPLTVVNIQMGHTDKGLQVRRPMPLPTEANGGIRYAPPGY